MQFLTLICSFLIQGKVKLSDAELDSNLISCMEVFTFLIDKVYIHTYIHILQSIMHIHTFIYLLFNQKSNACMHTYMLGLVCRFLSAPAGQEIAQRAVGQLRRGETRCRPGKHSYIHTYRHTDSYAYTHQHTIHTLTHIYIHTYIPDSEPWTLWHLTYAS